MTSTTTSGQGLHRRVHAPKTAELIADQLRGQIVRRVLKAGDTLPSELELGKQFGVSRPTLREAFRILENESLIVVRRGSRGGVQVVSPDIAVAARYVGLLLQMSDTTLADLFETFTLLEMDAVRRLAACRTEQDLTDLNECVDQLAELVDRGAEDSHLDRWSDVAFQFHGLIIERAGNQTLGILSGVLRGVGSGHMSRTLNRTSDHIEITAQFKKAIGVFRTLIALVEKKDVDLAGQCWRTHLETVGTKMFFGSLATESVVDLFN